MRTTLDLPEDLLETAKSIARGRRQSLGQTVADLMREALEHPPVDDEVRISPITGLPLIHLGRPTTLEDVRSLDDDD